MVVMEILTAPWEACKIMAVIVASVVCVFAGGWGGKMFYLYTDPEFTWGRDISHINHTSRTSSTTIVV